MLIVEDGTLVAQANSYVTIDEANAYWALRLNNAWVNADESDQTKWLIEAADFLNSFYTWQGTGLNLAQTMALPTDVLYAVPSNVKVAQILLADQARQAPLPMVTTGAPIKSLTEKLDGVGETVTEYSDPTLDGARTFSQVNALLGPFTVTVVGSSFQTARLLRA